MEHNYCYGCMQHVEEPGQVCPLCGFDPAKYEIDPHQLQPGTILHNRYMVGKVIGEGGFGITYVGRDTLLDMKVAVKEFYMNGFVNRNNTVSMLVQASVGTNAELFEKNKEKFIDEARVLAKFADEDGIVGIRDFFEENNTAYMIMDFLEGQTLRSYLDKNSQMAPEDVIRIMRPVMNSLQNVHDNNVIHRDISPDNIMMLKNNRVKLLDFGAAREISKTDIRSLSVILKPGYAPEEQYRSKGKQGPWTDVYALCATMYRCISGVTPDDAMERMFDDNLAPLSEVSACSPSVSSVIMKGLSVRQEGRYQSVRELQQDLERALRDPSFTAAVPVQAAHRVQNSDATIYAGAMPAAPQPPVSQPRYTAPQQAQAVSRPQQTAPQPPVTVPGMQQTAPQPPVTAPRPQQTAPKTAVTAPGAQNTIQAQNPVYVQPQKTDASAQAKKDAKEKTGKKKKWWLIPVIAVPALLFLILGIVVIGAVAGKTNKGFPPTMEEYQFELNGVKYSVPLLYEDLARNGWEFEDASVAQKELPPGGSELYVKLINGYGYIQVHFYNPTESTLPLSEAEIDGIYVASVYLNDNYLDEERNTFSCITNTENTFLTMGKTTQKDMKSYKKYAEVKVNTYLFQEDATHRIQVDFYSNVVNAVTMQNRKDEFIQREILQAAPEFDAQALIMELPCAISDTIDGTNAVFACGVQVQEYVTDAGWTIEKAPEYLGSHMEGDVYMRLNTTTTAVVKAYNPFDDPLVIGECIVTEVVTENVETNGSEWYLSVNGTVYEKWSNEPATALKQLGFTLSDSETNKKYTFTSDSGASITVYLNDDLLFYEIWLETKDAAQQFVDSMN